MGVHGHWRTDRRNLALHEAALRKLRADPGLAEACRALLDRWLRSPELSASRPYLARWRELLAGSLDELSAVVPDEERGQALRQCSPLGPVFTARERWKILAGVNRELSERGTR